MFSRKKLQEFQEAREEMIKKMLVMKNLYKFERHDSKKDDSTELVCSNHQGKKVFTIKRTIKKNSYGVTIREYQFDMLGTSSKFLVDAKDKIKQEEIKYIDVAMSKIKPTVKGG